MQSKEHIKNQT